jgi:hypothetical protein
MIDQPILNKWVHDPSEQEGEIVATVSREGRMKRCLDTDDWSEPVYLTYDNLDAEKLMNDLNELDQLRILKRAVIEWSIAIDVRSPNGAYDAEKNVLALLPKE